MEDSELWARNCRVTVLIHIFDENNKDMDYNGTKQNSERSNKSRNDKSRTVRLVQNITAKQNKIFFLEKKSDLKLSR